MICPKLLSENFDTALKKKNKSDDQNNYSESEDSENEEDDGRHNYRNTTLKTI